MFKEYENRNSKVERAVYDREEAFGAPEIEFLPFIEEETPDSYKNSVIIFPSINVNPGGVRGYTNIFDRNAELFEETTTLSDSEIKLSKN